MDVSTLERKFQKPEGFSEVQFDSHRDDTEGILGRLDSDDIQLWLIQTPHDVDVKNFDGHKVVLTEEPCICQLEESGRKFEIIANANDLSHKSLASSAVVLKVGSGIKQLTSVKKSFLGHLNILDNVSIQVCDLPEVEVKKRMIPEGLRQRFIPFGAVIQSEIYKDNEVKVNPPRTSKFKKDRQDDGENENKLAEVMTPEISSSRKRAKSLRLKQMSVKEEIMENELDNQQKAEECDVVLDASKKRKKSSRSSRKRRKSTRSEPNIKEENLEDEEVEECEKVYNTSKSKKAKKIEIHDEKPLIKLEKISPVMGNSVGHKTRRTRQ